MDKRTRMSLKEYLEEDGRELVDILEAVTMENENAPALCTEGCEVEPDGTCPHGNPSILIAAGMI